MDLRAYANTYDKKLEKYINKFYGEIPRCRGYELMKIQQRYGDESGEQTRIYNKYVGQDVIYIHSRCGDCGMGYEDEDSNYVYCGAKEWEEKHKDLFLEHCTDEFDSTYCDHYFKAVVNNEYKKLVEEEEKEK